MGSRPPVAIGSGVYVAGVAGAVALSAGRAPDTVAAVAVVAFCVGLVAGGALVTTERGARLLDHRLTAVAAGGALFGLGAWVTWVGLQTGAGGRYQLAVGSVFLAVIGWGIFAGGDRRAGPNDGFGETLARLPRTDPRHSADASGRRRWLGVGADAVTVAVVGYFAWRAVAAGDLYSGLFAGVFFAVFRPGRRYSVALTDGGVVTTRYVVWLVPTGRTVVPWTAIYGYEATDDRLRLATDYGRDLTYDPDRVDDRDRVTELLDDRLPRL